MYKIQSIQALRFFAALLVVFDHAILALTYAGSVPSEYSSLAWLMGEMGVYVFFAISGFIMLLTNEERFEKRGATGDFLLRRVIRVAPIYWIFTTWIVVSSSMNTPGRITAEQALKSYLFIPVANNLGQMRPVHGVGWTLNYEMLFYALFAMTMALRFKAGVMATFGALALLVLVGVFLRSPFEMNEPHGFLEVWTSPILLLFGFGMLIGLARRRFKAEALTISPWMLCALMAAPLFAFQLTDGGSISVIWRVFAAAMAILVVAVAAFTRLPAVTERFLVYGGDASYSLYLVHTFVIGALYRRLPDMAAHSPVIFFITVVTASLCAGFVVRQVVEKPLTRLIWAAIPWFRSLPNLGGVWRGPSASSPPMRSSGFGRKRTAPRN